MSDKGKTNMTEAEARALIKKMNRYMNSKPRRTIYETNYERIKPFITGKQHVKLYVDGYMPLVIERLGDNQYSLTHYYIQNGDLMKDPDMEVRIVPGFSVEAMTYQQDNMGIYQEVYPAPGKYSPYLKKELNSFLKLWLDNLKKQGFVKAMEEYKEINKPTITEFNNSGFMTASTD